MRSWSAFITTRPLTPQKMAQKPISGGLIVTDQRLGSNLILWERLARVAVLYFSENLLRVFLQEHLSTTAV